MKCDHIVRDKYALYDEGEMKATDNRLGMVQSAQCSYAVTGTYHGSIVYARSEGEARGIFHKYYNGESITHISKQGTFLVD